MRRAGCAVSGRRTASGGERSSDAPSTLLRTVRRRGGGPSQTAPESGYCSALRQEAHRGAVPAAGLAVVPTGAPRLRAPLRGEDQPGLDELDPRDDRRELGRGAGGDAAARVGAAQRPEGPDVDARI